MVHVRKSREVNCLQLLSIDRFDEPTRRQSLSDPGVRHPHSVIADAEIAEKPPSDVLLNKALMSL